jgi:hypothetical protein
MSAAGGRVNATSDWTARRPALAVAVALMLGIFCHRALPQWPLLWIGMLAILTAGAAVLIRSPRLCAGLTFLAMAAAGVGLAQLEALHYPRDHISAFASEQRKLAQLELSVDNPPRVLTWPYDQARASPPKQVLTASVTRIKTWTGWTDCSGDVLVQIAQPHPRLQQGQIVRVMGVLERPAPAMNPGQFNWAECAPADSLRLIRAGFWQRAGGRIRVPKTLR